MKVLMLSWEYPPKIFGGLGQHVFDLCRYVAIQGSEVHVITPRLEEVPDYEEKQGVIVHRAGYAQQSSMDFKAWTFYYNGDAIRQAVEIINESGPFDVVHAHDWLAAYAGRALARIYQIPLITTIHATEQGRSLGLHNRFQLEINEVEKNLALEARLIICCSRFMAGEVQGQFGIPFQRIRIIPNGVDREQLLAGDCIQPDRGKSGPVLVFLGRLVHEKGVCHLMDAFCKVIKCQPGAVLYICGQGPEMDSLRARARRLGLDGAVFFPGFLSAAERSRIYRRADLVVIPSLYEPFGIVALEAMAAGLPLVASNTGGLAEIISQGQDGILVPPGDDEALAAAITSLLENPAQARILSNNARETVAALYDWNVIAAATCDAYRELTAARGADN